jgi:hypothetical protein
VNRTRSWAFIALTVFVVPLAAHAQGENLDQAKMYFNAGAQAYASGRYGTAVSAFQEAYRIAPRPALLFSIAQAERKDYTLSKQPATLHKAIDHYRQYLDQVPSGGRRSDAVDALAELEPLAGRVDASGPAPAASPTLRSETKIMVSSQTPKATASLDGKPPSEVPIMEEVAPGKHKVRVSADGYYDEEREVSVLPGATAPQEISLREKPALVTIEGPDGAEVAIDGRTVGTTPFVRPLEASSGRHLFAFLRNGRKPVTREVTLERNSRMTIPVHFETSGQRIAAFGLLAGGGVAVLTGGAFVAVALVEQGRAEDVLDRQKVGNLKSSDLDTYRQAANARDTWRTASVATLGAGVAALTAGALLYVFDKPTPAAVPQTIEPGPVTKPHPAEPMEVSGVPLFGPGVLGAQVVGRF